MAVIKYVGNIRPGLIGGSPRRLFPAGANIEIDLENPADAALLANPDFEAVDEEAQEYVPPPSYTYSDVVVNNTTGDLAKRNGSVLALDYATSSDLEGVETKADLAIPGGGPWEANVAAISGRLDRRSPINNYEWGRP